MYVPSSKDFRNENTIKLNLQLRVRPLDKFGCDADDRGLPLLRKNAAEGAD